MARIPAPRVTFLLATCDNAAFGVGLMTADANNSMPSTPPTERSAVWGGVASGASLAGYLGLLPFAAALGCVTLGAGYGLAGFGVELALAWGAVILTFVAAVHWGLALAGRWRWTAAGILGSILPSVVGALAVLAGGGRGLALLVVGFGMFWLYEHRVRAPALPADYLALRRNLTLGVCALLVFTAFAAEGSA